MEKWTCDRHTYIFWSAAWSSRRQPIAHRMDDQCKCCGQCSWCLSVSVSVSVSVYIYVSVSLLLWSLRCRWWLKVVTHKKKIVSCCVCSTNKQHTKSFSLSDIIDQEQTNTHTSNRCLSHLGSSLCGLLCNLSRVMRSVQHPVSHLQQGTGKVTEDWPLVLPDDHSPGCWLLTVVVVVDVIVLLWCHDPSSWGCLIAFFHCRRNSTKHKTAITRNTLNFWIQLTDHTTTEHPHNQFSHHHLNQPNT